MTFSASEGLGLDPIRPRTAPPPHRPPLAEVAEFPSCSSGVRRTVTAVGVDGSEVVAQVAEDTATVSARPTVRVTDPWPKCLSGVRKNLSGTDGLGTEDHHLLRRPLRLVGMRVPMFVLLPICLSRVLRITLGTVADQRRRPKMNAITGQAVRPRHHRRQHTKLLTELQHRQGLR